MSKHLQPLPYLAVVHLGLHHALHVFLLHGRRDPKTVAHAQDLCPALGVRHLHRAVQDNRPRVQLEKKHKVTGVRFCKMTKRHQTRQLYEKINSMLIIILEKILEITLKSARIYS